MRVGRAEPELTLRSEKRGQHAVADGAARLRSSPEFRAKVTELRAMVEAHYADQFQSASLFQRWLIRRRVEREVEARIREMAPSLEALY